MWLTLLWQNKGLVVAALAALLVLGLIAAVAVKSSQLDLERANNRTLVNERDVAIEAHDALTKEIERQQKIVADREIARQQQEVDYVRLQKTLAEALRANRVWADTRLPDGVREAVFTMFPASPVDSTAPGRTDPAADLSGR